MQDFSKFSCLVFEDGVREGFYRHRLVKKSDAKVWAQYFIYECGRESVMVINFDTQGHELPDAVVYVKGNEIKKL